MGVIELRWAMFSLELNRFEGDHADFDPVRSKSAPALRTSLLVRDTQGDEACGHFYAAVGRRYFVGLEDLSQPDTLRAALADAGLSPETYDRALGDPATWQAVLREHQRLASELGAFGVPSLRLDGGDGPCVFGPVIREVPSDEEAVELLEHVLWLMRDSNFYELKTVRSDYPDLPHVKRALEERAAQVSPQHS
jgi:DSBA-like thioredoxin domain